MLSKIIVILDSAFILNLFWTLLARCQDFRICEVGNIDAIQSQFMLA